MTLLALVTCDRTRHRQPCRAFLPLVLDDAAPDPLAAARASAVSAGWNLGILDECPSLGHDS